MKRFICAILILSFIMLCACASSGQEISNDAESTSTVANTTEPPQDESTEPIEPKEYPSGVDYDFSKYRKNIPDAIYTTPASENGLAGKLYQITGTVEKIKKRSGYDCYIIETEDGDVSVMTGIEAVTTNDLIYKRLYSKQFDSYYQMPEVGEYVTIYAEYMGFSDTLDLPAFKYGGTEYFTTALLDSVRSSDYIFKIGNLIFAVPDGFEMMYSDDYVVAIITPEQDCFISVSAIDISELSEEKVPIYLPQQHKSYMHEDAYQLEKSTLSVTVAEFDVIFNKYTEVGGTFDISANYDATFTDSWYAYTILFRADAATENGAALGNAFADFILSAQYVGKPQRFETVQ